MANAAIKLVVFDLGGVVVRICRSIREAGARVGITVDEEDLVPARRAERRAVHARYELGEIECEEFFATIARTTGGKYSAEQFRMLHEAWLIDEYPGVGILIDDLHAAGIDTGVLSNTNSTHWRQLTGELTIPEAITFSSPSKVRHLHASHLLRLAKPDPKIYHEFARRSGYAPESILFFDDLEANVLAARAAGWQSHQIDHTGDTAEQMRSALKKHAVLHF